MSIIQMSIQAGLLVIAIIIIRAIALNHLPKKLFLFLWGITLYRLLVPISISSRFSVYSIIDQFLTAFAPETRTQFMATNMLQFANPTVGESADTIYHPVFQVSPITGIWILGMMAIIIFFVAGYLKNYNELRFALPIRDNQYCTKWLAEHSLVRKVTLLQSDRITTPIAVGIMHPRIILPKNMNLDDSQLLEYILTHEYYHIRRYDAVWKMLILIALCIHWFNPMVWVMFLLVNRDLELICDEQVVSHLGEETKAGYAYALIAMAEQKSKFTPLYNGFSKNAAEERITAIMKIKKNSLATICVSLALVTILGIAFTTTAMAAGGNIFSTGVSEDRKLSSKEVQNSEETEQEWERFGVTYDSITGRVYYQGEKVRFFVDNRSSNPLRFSGTVSDGGDGSYYLVTRRDKTGKLIGIDEITEKEANKIADWRR